MVTFDMFSIVKKMWVLVALITAAGATSPIREKKCPVYSPPYKAVDCGPNAYWESCPPQCPPHQNCSLLWSKFACVSDDGYCCKPACRCKDGFYRDENFKCVTSQQCQGQPDEPTTIAPYPEATPKNVCRTNETYVECAARCGPYDTCPVDDSRAIVQCSQPYPCPPGCICQQGYKKRSADDDTCILAEECPPVNCTRPNEVWNSCPSGCRAEYCTDISQQSACNELLKNCQPKCVCAERYYRNENDICVPPTDCGQANCGENKTIVFCTFKCPNKFCPENDDLVKYACKPPRDCPPGCGCKDGYRFKSSQDNSCVLTQDCPPVTCTRPNEEWNSCPPPCYSDACADRNKTQSECYEPKGCSDPRCVCKQGYYRNANQVCVPACDCG
ncbi:zonadhesin-like isoform X2 [Hyposmocoma kahamanoa]|uniref:zonadhesin-like isoform X2 n=1 Tax=Hyposmocoma kahamanoa TaxID=1477025 RepID=UPI000E6D66CF|nr:zonadhesin-like isoform X2 [Hyposmocoma kahamanoa]